MIAFSGMALGFADQAAQQTVPNRTETAQNEKVRDSASVRRDQQAIREKIDRDLRNGKYTDIAKLLPQVQPQLKDLTEVELLRIVADRARQLLEEDKANGFDAQRPGSNNGTGNGDIVIFPNGATDVGERDRGILGPGEWNTPPGFPRMGEEWRVTDTNLLERERAMRLQFLAHRSQFGNTVPFPNTAFADAVQDPGGGGIWPPLALPSNTRDFDGDGEVFDPLPARPVVIYYQFLEENMTDIEWVAGEDTANLVGLRTNDDNEDDVVDFLDNADETDGIADQWVTGDFRDAFINRSVIPPPDLTDFDEELAPFLLASGFGPVQWGDDRPVFLHPDAEAAWRLAQSLYPLPFEETWNNNQVLEEEERLLVLEAMRIIESVTNIVFLERPDWGGFNPQVAPPLQSFGPGISYPLNVIGYSLEVNAPTLAVDPGGIVSGDPALVATTEVPWYPEDDYPWMLIMKGSNPADGENGPSGVTELGTTRNATGLPSIDYLFADLDGDGFPDTPDSNGDGIPDQIIFSSLGFGNVVPMDPAGRSVLDNNLDTMISAADTVAPGFPPEIRGLQSGASLPLPIANFRNDYNLDGAPDTIIDTNADGDATVLNLGFPILPVPLTDYGDISLDLNDDGMVDANDSVFPNAMNPSPFHLLFETIPCSRFGLTQAVFDTEDIGFIVAQLVGGPLSFLPEHNRPDREAFIRVLEENIDSNAGGLDIIPGGSDKYANFIDNFDTTTETIPAAGLSPHLPGTWTLDNAGAGFGSGWAFLDPSTVPADVAAGVTPPEDYAVDDDDMSAIALVTGPAADTGIRGTAVMYTPLIYGPEDATVRFAYWVNSGSGDPIQDGDGLIVQSSLDGGTTWTDLIELRDQAAEWRLAEVVVGEDRADDQTGLPTFQVRFIAQNLDASRTDIEIAIDRIRVQNPYDFLSITHGGPFTAARTNDQGFETIQVREGFEEFQDRIGTAQGLSLGDRIALANLYNVPIFPDGDGEAPDPCRADMNGDGIIGAVDVALFLQLFNAGDMRADFADPEGVLDIFDLIAFFTDVQNSFRCINDPDNNFGENNLTNITPG